MAEPPDLSVAETALLVRYLAGQTTPAETEEVERWMAAHPDHRRALAMLERAFEVRAPTAEPVPEASSAADVWRRLVARLPEADAAQSSTSAPGEAEHEPRRSARVVAFPGLPASARRWGSWTRYAAAAAIVIAAGAGVLWRAGVGRPAAPATGPVAMREYVTPRGQRADFRLTDGTHVLLSVDSRLRVSADYGARDRQVYLEGEAYFEVEHHPAVRFLVHTAHAVTEDLGTRFDVRAYRNDAAMQVVVAEGRVAVRAGGAAHRSEALLGAGQVARATAVGEIVKQTRADVDQYLAWTQGRLVFNDTPLADALPDLSRWFDLEFRLGDRSLAGRQVTAAFQPQPTDQMLAVLALALDARWERHGRVVTFYASREARK